MENTERGALPLGAVDYRRLRECPMCGSPTGLPCVVLTNYDGTLKPGNERPVPHFYRTEIGK